MIWNTLRIEDQNYEYSSTAQVGPVDVGLGFIIICEHIHFPPCLLTEPSLQCHHLSLNDGVEYSIVLVLCTQVMFTFVASLVTVHSTPNND